MDEEIKQSDWIRPFQEKPKSQREPLVDKDISNIAGKEIRVNDPRLIKLVCKWRNEKNPDDFDNFLKDPKKIRELRDTFK